MKEPDNEIKDFYDNFPIRLLSDYLYGNERVLAALDFVLGRIRKDAVKVLDIGCGIGWVSHEIGRNFPNASIMALDLSPELVKTGRLLFESDRIDFQQKDVTAQAFTTEFSGRYDVIVMIDVYEHIPAAARDEFNRVLGTLLSPTGTIILTTPTVDYQDHLRKNEPHKLQPVDENIDLAVIQGLAEATATEIEVFKPVHIWEGDDYQHICLSRPGNITNPSAEGGSSAEIEGSLTKLMRIRRKVPKMKIDYKRLIQKRLNSVLGKN